GTDAPERQAPALRALSGPSAASRTETSRSRSGPAMLDRRSGARSLTSQEQRGEDQQSAAHGDDHPRAQSRNQERIARQRPVDDLQLQRRPAGEREQREAEEPDPPAQLGATVPKEADSGDHAEHTARAEEAAIQDVHAAIRLKTREQRKPGQPGADHDGS